MRLSWDFLRHSIASASRSVPNYGVDHRVSDLGKGFFIVLKDGYAEEKLLFSFG